MKERKLTLLLGLLLCCVMLAVVALPTAVFAADGDVEINESNFSDSVFRSHVEQYDTNSDGVLSTDEIAAVTTIDVSDTEIASLTGITYFTALESLDLSGCTNFDYLDLRGLQSMGLSSLALDVSGCTNLSELLCHTINLTSLDVSGCTALKRLDCYENKLRSLDVSSCTALERLLCYDNDLTSLNVSGCTALTNLRCETNKLTSLDVSGCTALTTLSCNQNNLSSLDVSGYTAIKYLNCYENDLTSLNVSGCTALYQLKCYDNDLTSLDVSSCTALEKLECYKNDLTSLDVSDCTALWMLVCYENNLSTLNLPQVEYISLDCHNNQLTVLDFGEIQGAQGLDCSNNQLTALDLSKFEDIGYLACSNNKLTALELSNLTGLGVLQCNNNQLTYLDLSANTKLEMVQCSNNQLTSLDVSKATRCRMVTCENTAYSIHVFDSRTFDLSTLPGFDVSKASAWTGGSLSGNILTADGDASQITYTYDIGNELTAEFTLNVHELTLVPAKDATCTEAGNTAYYTCGDCGKWFSDEAGAQEITDESSVVAAATGHAMTHTPAKEATCTEAGNIEYYTCGTCGKLFSDAAGTAELTPANVALGAAGHDMAHTAAKEPTCTEAGNTAYYVCEVCGKWFSDEAGTQEITDKSSVVVAASGHKCETVTETENGLKYEKCTVCAEKFNETQIDKPDNVNPNTGDNTNLALHVTLLCVSAAAIFLLYIEKRRSAMA